MSGTDGPVRGTEAPVTGTAPPLIAQNRLLAPMPLTVLIVVVRADP